MKVRIGLLVAALVTLPALAALAEDVPFKGRTLEVDANQEARPILRMVGSRYALPRTQAQLFEKGKACLAGPGVTLTAEDAVLGTLSLDVRTEFSAGFSDRAVRSRLLLEVGEGYFQLTESELAQARTDGDDGEVFVPLVEDDDIWEDALDALVKRETGWVDCLYK